MTGKNKYKVVLVGNPNVGKSVLFYNLTGNYSDKKDKNAFKKICSLGILPGVEVAIIQKTPTIVFQVYNGIFAIDSYLGDKINVKLYRNQS